MVKETVVFIKKEILFKINYAPTKFFPIRFTMSGLSIPIHPITHNPTEAWEQLRSSQRLIKLNVKTPTTPPDEKMVRKILIEKEVRKKM